MHEWSNTRNMKDRGFTRLRYAHQGRRDKREDMAFSTFMFEGGETQDDYASTDKRG